LSLLKLTYLGKLTYIYDIPCYEVISHNPPFVCVRYYFCEIVADPKINRIVFVFQDNKSAGKVRQLAQSIFGQHNVINTIWDSLIWQNISGMKVTIKQHRTYEVEKNNKKENARFS